VADSQSLASARRSAVRDRSPRAHAGRCERRCALSVDARPARLELDQTAAASRC